MKEMKHSSNLCVYRVFWKIYSHRRYFQSWQNGVSRSIFWTLLRMQDYHPRGNRSIDRMTNVPGSRRLLPGLINQTIFPVSTSRFPACHLTVNSRGKLAGWKWSSLHCYITFHFPFSFLMKTLKSYLPLMKFLPCEFYFAFLVKSPLINMQIGVSLHSIQRTKRIYFIWMLLNKIYNLHKRG